MMNRNWVEAAGVPVTVENQNDMGVVLTCSGLGTGEEFINVARSLVTERNRGLKYIIVDLTEIDDFQASTAEVRAVASENVQLAHIAEPKMLVAVAATKDIGFGIARMWEVYASFKTAWRISVFRSRGEANAWIQQNLR
jgi:hypothetical protein